MHTFFYENSARNNDQRTEMPAPGYQECIENFKIALRYFIVVVTSAFNNANDDMI